MDLDDILTIIALLLPPVVLWRCKSFCEKHPSTVPFRTVPLGCLTMFLLAGGTFSAGHWLFHKVLERNEPHWMTGNLYGVLILLFALLLGIAVIVYLSIRISHTQEIQCGCLYPIVFAGAILVAIVISCASTFWNYSKNGLESGSWHTIFLPRHEGYIIAFEQRHTHPFLAEYDYRIRLRQGKTETIFRLWPNCSNGRTFVNVYRVGEDKLFLNDNGTCYIIDLTQVQVYLFDTPFEERTNKPLTEIHFAVPLSSKAFKSMGGSSEQDLHVNFEDGTTSQAIPYHLDLSEREYTGCVMDYSFYTPDEQPEGEGHPNHRNDQQEKNKQ